MMKNRIPVRILTALGGLVLLGAGAGAAAEGFFGVPVTAALGQILASGTAVAVLGKILGTLLLAVLAVAAILCALPSRRVKQSDYVMQKGTDGPIGIAVKAIEKKVMACVAKHEEIAGAEVAVREVRDGIIILLNVDQVSGVSIPLSVSLLQRQIRQYVRECTGVDVVEVRVMVDNRTDAQVASAFRVEDAVAPTPAPRTEDYRQEGQPLLEAPVDQLQKMAEIAQQPPQEPEPAVEPAPARPVTIPDELLPTTEEAQIDFFEEEKPLHQRVFGAEEETMTVPMPPESQEIPAPEAAPVPQTEPAQEPAPEEGTMRPLQEDWTEPSLQAAAEEMLASSTDDDVTREVAGKTPGIEG